jgi:hypothetical protein
MPLSYAYVDNAVIFLYLKLVVYRLRKYYLLFCREAEEVESQEGKNGASRRHRQFAAVCRR